MKSIYPSPEPLNAEERFLYAIISRLDVIIDLLPKPEITINEVPHVAQSVQEEFTPAPKRRGKKKEV